MTRAARPVDLVRHRLCCALCVGAILSFAPGHAVAIHRLTLRCVVETHHSFYDEVAKTSTVSKTKKEVRDFTFEVMTEQEQIDAFTATRMPQYGRVYSWQQAKGWSKLSRVDDDFYILWDVTFRKDGEVSNVREQVNRITGEYTLVSSFEDATGVMGEVGKGQCEKVALRKPPTAKF